MRRQQMRKVHNNGIKITKSPQSAQVGGQSQIAVVENTPAGADGIRR